MIKKVLKTIISAVVIAIPLLIVGMLISYLWVGSLKLLSAVLFVIGAIPVVVFSSGLLGRSTSGAIHTPKVIYRLVGTLTPKKNSSQSSQEIVSNFFSSLNWILAGVIIWIISYFI